MAFSTQNITFNTDTGFNYTAADVEFVSGVCRAKSGFTGQSVVVTPTIDVSSWNSINSLVFTASEKVDGAAARYFHDVLVSFSAGASTTPASAVWQKHYTGGWITIPYTDIATRGMSLAEITNVKVWPAPSNLTFAFNIHREAGSTLGSLDNLAIVYHAAADHEDQSTDFPTEPASNADVATDLAIYPEFPGSIEYETGDTLMATPGGYHLAWRNSTAIRRTINSPRFIAINTTNKDLVLAFLRAHIGQASFTWDPPGCKTGCKWVAIEPIEDVQLGADNWEVSCSAFVEVLPA